MRLNAEQRRMINALGNGQVEFPLEWAETVRRVVLHVHRNPRTGVWAIMKQLAVAQNRDQSVLSLIGVPADRYWLAGPFLEELEELEIPFLAQRVPAVFGTAAFLAFIVANPLRLWMENLQNAFPSAEILLHSHSAWLTGAYLPLRAESKASVVATFHGIADDDRLQRIWWLRAAHRCLARRLCHSGATLTAVSKDTAVRAERILLIPRDAFHTVQNGIAAPAVDMRKRRTDPAEPFLVGHVGQMHRGKGWHLLLEAVDRLHARGAAISLILAGMGPDADEVREAARGRSEYVEYLAYVPNAGANVIPRLNALVLASWTEGMPMAVVEAFAAGIPVLATSIGGIPEMLRNGYNGMFIERSVDSIESAIDTLIRDPDLCSRLSQGALATFRENYEISVVVDRYHEIYGRALYWCSKDRG